MRSTAPSKSAVRITIVALTVLVAVMIAGGTTLAVGYSSDSTVGLAQQQQLETESAAPLDSAISSSIAGQSASDGAFFDVEIVETNDPVEFGESDIEVTVRIENTGDEEGTREIVAATRSGTFEPRLTLEPGESVERTFQFEYEDIGDFDITVSVISGESASTVVRVVDDFQVEITDTNSPVEEGDTLEVTADVELLAGEKKTSQEIELDVDGLGTDSKTVTLQPESFSGDTPESTTETFRVDTEAGDAGEYTATVSSLTDSDSTTVGVTSASDGPFFDVEIVETNDPVEFGESDIELTARFENTGNREGSQLVSGSAAEGFDESILTLEPGESTEITYRFDYIESGEYTARIQSLNETETTVVRVVEPFDVEITDTNSPVEEGDTLAVTADIRSTGDQEETQEIELEVDGIGTDSEDVTLEDGESTTETFRVDTEAGDAGEYTATVASLTDSDSTTVRVTESDEEVVYWQVDFGEGEDPPMPPSYWPNDLVAALGNSEDGVTQNPSLRRQGTDGQLGDVTIVDNEFEFDDDGEPTEVTVEFEIDEDGETRDLHLASFTLPGPFDEDEIDQQELFDDASGTYDGGDTGELTVSIPQADD